MILVRGYFEIAELLAAFFGSVIFYLSGFYIVPLKDAPDLSTILFILSVVLLLNHARVNLFAPLDELWRLFLELGCFYLCTQFIVLCVWEPFHFLLHVLRDSLMNTRPVLNLLVDYPKVFVFLRQDCWYFLKLLTAIAITLMTVNFTHAWDYVYGRRRYQYVERALRDRKYVDFYKRTRRYINTRIKPRWIREELKKSLIDY
ncbi:uncharacterized protein [Drosophila bipectinata]|uniref:uncharacterized protein n=1 Tax=Drosophila bipectinata TaxID=42026 RepID=UPI001C890D10|nr:uncharacterized protein LOC108123529 [Drosophila bipectinata]